MSPRPILIAGPGSITQAHLCAYLEESGFLPISTTLQPCEWEHQLAKPDMIFWFPTDSTNNEKGIHVWPGVPKVLVTSESKMETLRCLDLISVCSEPLDWTRLFVLLQQCFPEDDAILSEVQVGDWVDFSLASNREIFTSMKKFLFALLHQSTLPREDIYAIHYAICEIMLNSMEHGNHFDSRKRVHGSYVLFQDVLVVKFEDQGAGFLPKEVPNPISHPIEVANDRNRVGKRRGGYGLALARKWMELSYSDRGTAVLLTRRF